MIPSFDIPSVETFIAAILFSSRWNLIMFVSFSQLNFTFKIKAHALEIAIKNLFLPIPRAYFGVELFLNIIGKSTVDINDCYNPYLPISCVWGNKKLYYVLLLHPAWLHVSLVVTKNGMVGVVECVEGGGASCVWKASINTTREDCSGSRKRMQPLQQN